MVVIAELLGVPSEMAPQLLDWSHRMVAMFQLGRTREMEDSAEAATKEFSAFLRGYVNERRKRPADDLITHLLAAEAAGDRLSEDELIATCILLLNAGHEATVHAIGNSVKTLLEEKTNPAEAFASDAATEATVEECLRFDPPLHLFNRVVQEDLETAGVSLRRGSEVALLYGAANRDPARYPRPTSSTPDDRSPARPSLTPPLAEASISALGPPWRDSNFRFPCRSSFSACPAFISWGAPATATTTIFTGSRPSTSGGIERASRAAPHAGGRVRSSTVNTFAASSTIATQA